MDWLWWHWAILIGANTPMYLLIGWAIFDSWGGFFEAIKYYLTPDFWSFLVGEWAEDWWAEFKLFIFAIACAAVVVGEWWVIHRVWG